MPLSSAGSGRKRYLGANVSDKMILVDEQFIEDECLTSTACQRKLAEPSVGLAWLKLHEEPEVDRLADKNISVDTTPGQVATGPHGRRSATNYPRTTRFERT